PKADSPTPRSWIAADVWSEFQTYAPRTEDSWRRPGSYPVSVRSGSLLDFAFLHFLTQPLAMVPPAPAASYCTAGHPAQRPAYPEGGIDVHNPNGDGEDGR